MKNVVRWRDIVKIGDEYFLEEFDVEFENQELNNIEFGNSEEEILKQLEEAESLDDEPLYDCEKFFVAVREKYNVSEYDYLETYLFDDLDLPKEICEKYDIAWLGGYINGVNI